MLFNSKVNPVMYIAEVGSNHEGNFSEAKKLVKNACKSKADVVKLQIFSPENMVSKKYDEKRFKHFKNLQLTEKQNLELLSIIKSYKKKTSASIWDTDQVDIFKKKIDIFKIGSGDIHNFQIIKKILITRKPIIISTGLCNFEDIKATYEFIKKTDYNYIKNKKLAILHCNTAYPTPFKDSNLGTIDFFKKNFDLTIGYSDHTIGDEVLFFSYLAGARIIEKHFSNDVKKKTFRDHAISLNKNSVDYFLKKLSNVSMCFDTKKELSMSEIKQKNLTAFRRSIYAKKRIKKGDYFTEDNVICLRPFLTNTSKDFFKLINKKSKKNYNDGEII